MFHTFPSLARYVSKQNNWKYKLSDNYQALGIFGVLIKTNSIYSTLIIVCQQSAYCSSTERGLGWSLVVLCTQVATGVIIELARATILNEPSEGPATSVGAQNAVPQKCQKCLSIFFIIILAFQWYSCSLWSITYNLWTVNFTAISQKT